MSKATKTKSEKNEWKCPNCGAGAGVCPVDKYRKEHSVYVICDGLLCECDKEVDGTHGVSLDNPCENANCYHCDWHGTLPQQPLKGWRKTAWEAGWRPQ